MSEKLHEEISEEVIVEDPHEIGYKSIAKGGYTIENDKKRLDRVHSNGKSKKEQEKLLGGEITSKNGKNHYKGVLGEFSYDPKQWAIGTKSIGNDKTVPVLRYIGDEKSGDKIDIPKGVKNLDYTFEGNDKIETVPYIPDSVESAHAAFMDCKNIKRASKDAKSGEHNGGWDILGWAGGGAAAGAGAGFLIPIPGIGPAIGAGVGTIGGVVKGVFECVTNDGIGFTLSMPKNLKDASYMFAGCEKLTEGYEAASENLIYARNMYEGNKNIGTDSYANKKGSVAVTDFTDSKLSKESVEDSYTDANVEVTPKLKNNYSKDWDEESGTINSTEISQEDKVEVENLNQKLKAKDVRDGKFDTEMSVQTDGLASTAKQKTDKGWTTTTDINAKNEKDGGLNFNKLLDRGLVTVAEFGILKMVTRSTLVAGAATIGLQMVGVLPKSMRPILDTVANFVGKDNPVGKAISNFSDTLAGDGKRDVKPVAPVDSKGDLMVSSIKDPLLVASGEHSGDITKAMTNNSKTLVQNGVFLDVGKGGKSATELRQLSQISSLAAGGLEEKALSMVENDKLSKEDKEQLCDNYTNVLNGLQAYNKTATEEIEKKYGKDTPDAQIAKDGLNQVMQMVVDPMFESMREIDDKYDFMDKEFEDKVDKMAFSGVENYKDYKIDKSDDDEIYANAGLEESKSVEKVKDDAKDVVKEHNEGQFNPVFFAPKPQTKNKDDYQMGG